MQTDKIDLNGEFERANMKRISGLRLSITKKHVWQFKEEELLTEISSRSPLCWAIPLG